MAPLAKSLLNSASFYPLSVAHVSNRELALKYNLIENITLAGLSHLHPALTFIVSDLEMAFLPSGFNTEQKGPSGSTYEEIRHLLLKSCPKGQFLVR